MNSIMNKAQLPNTGLWFCDVYEKEKDFSSRLRHINSNTHIHKKNMVSFVENMKLLKQKLMK